MKVLWLCNTLLPHVAKELGISVSKPESWILGTYERLKSSDEISLIYLFPYNGPRKTYTEGKNTFVSYPQKKPTKFEKAQVAALCDIFHEYNPDVIKCFGSEYPHTYAAMLAAEKCGMKERTLIHIQGLSSAIALHYDASLPFSARHSYTFRDFLRRENIAALKKDFRRRGEYEKKAIALTANVTGRTDWDFACTEMYHPGINYHFCNETLRPTFYKNEWSYENCEKHSIFVSQCSYPLKGFHYMLEAMTEIVKSYPDAMLYTTGKNPLALTLKQKLRQNSYNKYLGKLIKKYHLEKHVKFLGFLKEEDMCNRYLSSHVFVSASSIENSPNSVGEAMILGTPVISSDVGGVKNLMAHEKDGFIYQADAPYMLAYYVKKMFRMGEDVKTFSENAKAKAQGTHNAETNFEALLSIYRKIAEGGAKSHE